MAERVGVLVVHGIGEQRRGSSVRQAADALARALRPGRTVTFAGVDVDPDGGREPAHLELFVEAPGEETARWLLAESWWARAFEPPSFGSVLRWAWRVAPGLLVVEAARRRDRDGDLTATGYALLMLTPLTVALIALLAVVSLLPVDRVRAVVGRVQVRLTGTLGDSAVLDDGVLGGAIASRVGADLAWLAAQPDVERIVVLAHSQGAAIAHRVLRPRPGSALPGVPLDLVTFGSGLDKLTVASTLHGAGATERARLLLAGLLGGLGSLAVLTAANLASPWLLPALLAVLAAFLTLARATRPLARRAGVEDRAKFGWALLCLASLVLVGVVSWRGAPGAAGGLLGTGAVLLFGGQALLRATPAVEAEPTAVRSWLDVRSSFDPVPTAAVPPGAEQVLVHNAGSLVRDHTTYWANGEEFVPVVLHVLGVDVETPSRRRSRATLLGYVQLARVAVLAAGGYAVTRLWDRLPDVADDVVEPVLRALSRIPLVDLTNGLTGEDRWLARWLGALLVLAPALVVARLVRAAGDAALARRARRP